jgi:hypothetical protein
MTVVPFADVAVMARGAWSVLEGCCVCQSGARPEVISVQ